MANRPKVVVDVEIAGAKQGINDLEAVADAQEGVGEAAAKAGAAADKAGKQAEGARSRWGKLVDGLKAGAGAAASASAGIAGVAATLNADLSDANKTAVAGLQGLSGVLGAFGPVGALASAAVSGVAFAVATFGDTSEEAGGQVDNFFTRALNDMSEALKTSAMRADEAAAGIRQVQQAAATEADLFTGRQLAERNAQKDAQNRARQQLAELTTQYQQTEDNIRQAERLGQSWAFADRDRAQAYAAAQARMSALREDIGFVDDFLSTMPTAGMPAVPAATAGGSGGPARPDWKAAYQAEVDAALAATEAIRQDRETDIYLQISAADALAAQVVRTAAEMQSAWSQAWYSSELEQSIAAGVAAQRDAIRAIEAEASLLTGIYDQLTSGVQAFGAAALEGFAAASVSAAIYGGAQLEVANKALQAATMTAATESAIALAKAGGYFAAGVFGYVPGFAAAKASLFSAATWGALAGGAAGLTAATGGFGGGGGGGGGPGLGGMSPDRQGRPEDFGERRFEQAEPTELRLNLGSGQAGMSRQDAAALLGALGDLVRASGSDGGALLSSSRRR